MTRQMMQDLMEHVFSTEIQVLREEGQKEYAHDEENAFANFDRQAEESDITPEQVLWVHAMKHKDGITAHIKGHTSQRENIRGRINDLIVYLFLLRGMVERREGHDCTENLDQGGIYYYAGDSPPVSVIRKAHVERVKLLGDICFEEALKSDLAANGPMDADNYVSRVEAIVARHVDPQSGEPLAREFGGIEKDGLPCH